MKTFQISTPDQTILESLIFKINDLTKPKGSLGTLEDIATQIGLIQQTLHPELHKPHGIIFAADHGIVDEGVSFSPKEVTRQMISNFLGGGAGINFLARQHNFVLKVVDGGIDYDFPAIDGLISRKVRKGTRKFLYESALTDLEVEQCIEIGAEVVKECHKEGCNIICFGELGIGNTSPSSMWMTCLAGIPLLECVGAGSGLDSRGVMHKYTILKRALDNFKEERNAMNVMRYFGGIEMIMAVGGMLQAAELNMIILVDGFIMTNCVLAASKLYPEVINYCVFGHQGDEAGHKLLLDHLKVKPLLNLGLRLGEGSGAICAYPIVESAVRMINEMNTFSNAAVTKYF